MTQSGRSRSRWLKRVLTWVVTASLLYWVFRTVPLWRVWQALEAAGPIPVLGLLVVYFVFSYAADVFATWATFGWFCVKLGFWDVVAVRGITYLLAIVNYNLGQGGIVYFVVKKHGVRIARATATVLVTMGVMFVALLLLAAIGSSWGPAGDYRLQLVRNIAFAGLTGFAVYLAILRLSPRFLARREVLAPLFDAGITAHFKAFVARFPHVAGHIVFQWMLLRMFGVEVPFLAAATLLPVVFVVAWLPIAVQGLGTQQVVAIALFSRYAVGADAQDQAAKVIACSLSQSAIFTILSLLTGLAFLKTATAHNVLAPPRVEST